MFINGEIADKTIEVTTAKRIIYAIDGKPIAILVGVVPTDARYKYLGKYSIFPIIYNMNQQYIAPEGIDIFYSTDIEKSNFVIDDIMNDIIDDIHVDFVDGINMILINDIDIYIDYNSDTHVDVSKSLPKGIQAWCSSVLYEFEDDDFMSIRKVDLNGNWYIDDPRCYVDGFKIDIKPEDY